MLLIFGDQNGRPAVTQHESDFIAGAGGIKAVADRTEALDRKVAHQPFRQRIADDGNAITPPHPERAQAETNAGDFIEQVDPTDVLIDAHSLRAQSHLPAPTGNDVEQQAGNCQRCLGRQGEPGAYEPPDACGRFLGALSSAQISGASGLSFPIRSATDGLQPSIAFRRIHLVQPSTGCFCF